MILLCCFYSPLFISFWTPLPLSFFFFFFFFLFFIIFIFFFLFFVLFIQTSPYSTSFFARADWLQFILLSFRFFIRCLQNGSFILISYGGFLFLLLLWFDSTATSFDPVVPTVVLVDRFLKFYYSFSKVIRWTHTVSPWRDWTKHRKTTPCLPPPLPLLLLSAFTALHVLLLSA